MLGRKSLARRHEVNYTKKKPYSPKQKQGKSQNQSYEVGWL